MVTSVLGFRPLGIQVNRANKLSVLSDLITVYGGGASSAHGKCIVFVETRRVADELASSLSASHACEVCMSLKEQDGTTK